MTAPGDAWTSKCEPGVRGEAGAVAEDGTRRESSVVAHRHVAPDEAPGEMGGGTDVGALPDDRGLDLGPGADPAPRAQHDPWPHRRPGFHAALGADGHGAA